MKQPLIALATVTGLLTQAGGVFAQGTINFDTSVLGTNAWVREVPGGFPIGDFANGMERGSNFFAQLYAGAGIMADASSASLVPIGNPTATPRPVNFRSGAGAGWVQFTGTTTLGDNVNQVVTIPASVLPIPGGIATLQLRVWWGGGTLITTFEQAATFSNPHSELGFSALFQIDTADPGNPLEDPATMNGFQGFALIPEPSTMALAGVGVIALLTFRRRTTRYPRPTPRSNTPGQ